MKILKYKDRYGKIHTVKNVKLFTGVKDKNGKEVYEGDLILVPSHRKSGKETKTDYVKHIVEVNGGYRGKVVSGTDHYEPYTIDAFAKEDYPTNGRYWWNWSLLFDCEKL